MIPEISAEPGKPNRMNCPKASLNAPVLLRHALIAGNSLPIPRRIAATTVPSFTMPNSFLVIFLRSVLFRRMAISQMWP